MYNIPFITGDLLLEEDKVDVLIVSLVLCFLFVFSWIASEDFDWEIDDADMLLKLKDTWYLCEILIKTGKKELGLTCYLLD